jgi:hypothetical protein
MIKFLLILEEIGIIFNKYGQNKTNSDFFFSISHVLYLQREIYVSPGYKAKLASSHGGGGDVHFTCVLFVSIFIQNYNHKTSGAGCSNDD